MATEYVIASNEAQPKMFGMGGMTGGMGGDSGGGGFIGDQTVGAGGDTVSGGVAPVQFSPVDLSWLGRSQGGMPIWGWLAIGIGAILFIPKLFKK